MFWDGFCTKPTLKIITKSLETSKLSGNQVLLMILVKTYFENCKSWDLILTSLGALELPIKSFKSLVFDKKCAFTNFSISKCSKIKFQTDFGGIFYTKPHQKTTADSLVASE